MAHRNLQEAKRTKNDEFYTRLEDIALELKNYRELFRGKVVFCNCDDPYESNFFKYFALNFNTLGLRKLIATCYDGSPIMGNELLLHFDIDEEEISKPKKVAYKVEITEVRDLNGDGAVDLSDVQYLLQNDKNVMQPLQGNGDFRSPECIELLKQADIVVTNPPFSLFREYVAQLVRYDKQFIIIGNTNAIAYKEIFPLIKDNKMFIGCTNYNVGMFFTVPDTFEKYHHEENGQKIARVSTSCWFTNIDHKKRHEPIILFKRYNADEYPKYVNFNAIEVSKVADIPIDYDGLIGVPLTYIDKHCPEQFEIVDISLVAGVDKPKDLPKALQGGPAFYLQDEHGNYKRLYTRILIRRKQ